MVVVIIKEEIGKHLKVFRIASHIRGALLKVIDSLFKQVILERNKYRKYIGDFMRNNTREERIEILYRI